jgi:hypothetical protein
MAELSYQDAVQMLRDRIGMRWEGLEADGRAEMVRLLRDKLGFSDSAAHDTIDAMVESGELRYHRSGEARDEAIAVAAPVAVGNTSSGTGIPMPVPPAILSGPGYWQIGREDDGPEPGRAGQVKPRGL